MNQTLLIVYEKNENPKIYIFIIDFFYFFIVIVIKVKSFLAESLPSTSYDSIFLGGGPDLRCYNLNNKFSPLLSTVTCRNKTGRGTAVLDCDVWSPTYSEAVMSIA